MQNITQHPAKRSATLDTEPPTSVSRFLEVSGLSSMTFWRMEKRGLIRTVRMAGRKYITATELFRFNERLKAGEFAGNTQKPRANKHRK